MNETIKQRCIEIGNYIAKSNVTVRTAAKKFGVSKSTVHKDVSSRLKKINPTLYAQVKKVLEKNKQMRHIRGGIATKNKYLQLREKLT